MDLETISRKDFTLNKELAYLFGVYLTDGSISEKNFQLQAIDKDFVEQTLSFWKKFIPSSTAHLRERSDTTSWNKQKRYVIKIGIGDFAAFFEGQTIKKHHIPLCIWKADRIIKRWFIAGIMDGDGWISKTQREYNENNFQYRIGIGGVEEGWIMEFRDLMQELGVKCNKVERYTTKNNKWFCRFHMNPKSFFNANLFFTIKRKTERCVVSSETAR